MASVRIMAPVRYGLKPVYGQGCRGVSLTVPFRTPTREFPNAYPRFAEDAEGHGKLRDVLGIHPLKSVA